jgi:hypothetical protein
MCVETKQPIPPIDLYEMAKITPRAPPQTACKPQRKEQRAKEETRQQSNNTTRSTTTSIAKTKTLRSQH